MEAAGLALNKAALLAQEGRSQELAEIGAECQRFDNTLEPEQARNLYLKATTMTREEVIAFLLHA